MDKLAKSNLKLGIISGGQLGKMLIQEASKLDITSYVMDNDENCSSRSIASHYVKGSNLDFDAVYNFGKMVDILTFEMENVNIDALQKLKAEGHQIVPDPDILALIQDKGLQKEFYDKLAIPSSPYRLYENKAEIKEAIERGLINYPFVQKLRKGGYDGRGVSVISDKNDLKNLLEGPSLIEEMVKIEKEISVIVARNKSGDVKSYPVVEMLFDPKANLVDKLICPSTINKEQADKAREYACQIIEALNMEGLLAVEFFIDSDGNIIVNEAAPRPHNSGHHTIESVITSQFEQHLRAVLNLPLGSTKLKLPSVMLNVLGEEGFTGPVKYEGLEESFATEGVKVHLYGKKITKPYRKMGHITILADSIDKALENADKVKNLIKVKSWKEN